MKKVATPKCKGLKRKTFDEKRGKPRMHGAQKKDLWWKKRRSKNARGSIERPPMKKEAMPKNARGSKERRPIKPKSELAQQS
jgi:hypothetical protein